MGMPQARMRTKSAGRRRVLLGLCDLQVALEISKGVVDVLTVTPFSPVQRHHEIRDFLNEAWDLADDFLTGSYRRDTKTKEAEGHRYLRRD